MNTEFEYKEALGIGQREVSAAPAKSECGVHRPLPARLCGDGRLLSGI